MAKTKNAIGYSVWASLGLLGVGVGGGALLGVVSWYVWVLGVGGLALGLVLGWSALVLELWLGLRRLWVPALLAAMCGWAVFYAFEDSHHQRAFQNSQARMQLAASGLDPAHFDRQLQPENIGFWADGADEALAEQVLAKTGRSGPVGRWLFRAEKGVRLAGSVEEARGLPVGLWGAGGLALAEILFSFWLIRRVASRGHDDGS